MFKSKRPCRDYLITQHHVDTMNNAYIFGFKNNQVIFIGVPL